MGIHRPVSAHRETHQALDCTYDQPSNRRRHPTPQYVESLESRLHKAESVLHALLPSLDLDDPRYDARAVDQIINAEKSKFLSPVQPTGEPVPEDDAELQSMVEATGSLDLDDQGHWDFHGHSSGVAFMRKLGDKFGELRVPAPPLPASKNRQSHQPFESPRSVRSSSLDATSIPSVDLPEKEVARELCRNALDEAVALLRLLHRPTFYQKLDQVFDKDPDQYTNANVRFLPLLYLVMAGGCLFAHEENTTLSVKGYEGAIEQGLVVPPPVSSFLADMLLGISSF